jgi:hypothetical protein
MFVCILQGDASHHRGLPLPLTKQQKTTGWGNVIGMVE